MFLFSVPCESTYLYSILDVSLLWNSTFPNSRLWNLFFFFFFTHFNTEQPHLFSYFVSHTYDFRIYTSPEGSKNTLKVSWLMSNGTRVWALGDRRNHTYHATPLRDSLPFPSRPHSFPVNSCTYSCPHLHAHQRLVLTQSSSLLLSPPIFSIHHGQPAHTRFL